MKTPYIVYVLLLKFKYVSCDQSMYAISLKEIQMIEKLFKTEVRKHATKFYQAHLDHVQKMRVLLFLYSC